MLFLLTNYGTPILFGIGIVICYIAKSQNEHLIYEYGFWSFVVFLVSRLISIIRPILISPGMGQEMAGGGMPFWLMGLNLFRE
ncbi:hypothetical protein [Natranaerofaba carboxydovora]|uniref:hypothetical protein n=1 Tax=Natranaerofaba carboxydovora TaxID=2742683 RepID=UPI001F1354FB|nr:hypothetical protein [Natranaerofaba carboxydovora]UMZ72983.1 hypothetical protein ACONDI_00525 [Natranaerofaba carboxydovora]